MLQGAVVGQIFGTAFIGWIAFGGLLYGKHANTSLPTSIQGCTATNSSDLSNSSQLFTTTALATSSRYKGAQVYILFCMYVTERQTENVVLLINWFLCFTLSASVFVIKFYRCVGSHIAF